MRILLNAAAGRYIESGPLIETVDLLSALVSSTGLSKDASDVVSAPNKIQNSFVTPNGLSDGGDGRGFGFKPRVDNRKVKSIQATFYYWSRSTFRSTFLFKLAEAGQSIKNIIGVQDIISTNGNSAFKIFSEVNPGTNLSGGTFNNVLKHTFATPVALEDIYLKVGGGGSDAYTPATMRNLIIEFA